MPRLLVNGAWFDPIAGSTMWEANYEQTILHHAPQLFPDFVCVPFKALIQSEYGNGKADLALIDREYRSWYVVEVELDSHSLGGHVEEQVQKFAAGTYTRRHAEALCRGSSKLDLDRASDMMLGHQPKVLVLVTGFKPSWAPRLAQYGGYVGVIEVFRDDLDNVVLRVNGDQPIALDSELLSECVVDTWANKVLKLNSPASFQGFTEVDLLVEGTSTRWTIVRVSTDVWLVPAERAPATMTAGSHYQIRRTASDLLLAPAVIEVDIKHHTPAAFVGEK